MGWLGKSEFNCPDCDGETDVECGSCGAMVGCVTCQETGWDPEQVDVVAFKEAGRVLNQKMMDAGCNVLTYEWTEGDRRRGRSGGEFGRIDVRDFLFERARQ